MVVQWYPGHMAKARRELQEILPLLDILIEVADARLPQGSRNPDLQKLLARDDGGNKPRILVLNKIDLADPKKIAGWLEYYKADGEKVVALNARDGQGLSRLTALLDEVKPDLSQESGDRGRIRRERLRIGVIGIPNVGKSSVLNRLAGRSATQVGNKPGVTRGRQWVKKDSWQILDTPGLLWPKITDPEKGWLLAFTGAVNPEILDPTDLAWRLIEMLLVKYPSSLSLAYQIDSSQTNAILEEIGRKKGCLVRGGKVDLRRAAELLWSDFRAGRLGRFTLEDPPLS